MKFTGIQNKPVGFPSRMSYLTFHSCTFVYTSEDGMGVMVTYPSFVFLNL